MKLRSSKRNESAGRERLGRYTARMQTVTFELDREYVELNQLLKLAGLVDSGGAGKALVANGEVKVDGEVELRKTCKIRAGQTVEVDNIRIEVSSGDRAARH